MKKLLIAVIVVAVVAVAGFAVFNVVQAQTPTEEPETVTPRGFGFHGNRGGGMLRDTLGEGWMHDEMIAAFSAKLGISAADLEARIDAGETLWDIASAEGMTVADFSAARQEAREKALDQAVSEGKLTEEQAELMKTRTGRGGMGMMRGDCTGDGPMGGRGWRGQGRGQQVTPAP
jgi:hypothetical protein